MPSRRFELAIIWSEKRSRFWWIGPKQAAYEAVVDLLQQLVDFSHTTARWHPAFDHAG